MDIVYAFGSHGKEALALLKGEVKQISFAPGSDLDIGIKPAKGKNLEVHQKVELALLFEDLFSAPRNDLIVIPEVDPFLAANVIRAERIYAKDHHLADEYDPYIMGVLPAPAVLKFKMLAEYRNRLVHFYHEITDKELYRICSPFTPAGLELKMFIYPKTLLCLKLTKASAKNCRYYY